MRDLTVLHTSDWHLGHQLYRRRRGEEFEAFLNWLVETIRQRHVEVIVIAGDIFDSSLPGSGAQKMYYRFLAHAARAGARHIVVTAGNHDSPHLLMVADELLRNLNIHIVGAITENPEDEIKILYDDAGNPELIICAVPYLRERDARSAEAGESLADRDQKLAEGIRAHYAAVAELAESLRAQLGPDVPALATGHLFTAGGVAGDGVRNLYVGNLGQVPLNIFPPVLDYVALGHLHRPQCVGGEETRRYSGSPLPMSFDEAEQDKSFVIIKFSGRKPSIETLPVPRFRQLMSIRGSRASILGELEALASAKFDAQMPIWLELTHDGSDHAGDIYGDALSIVAGTPLEILCARSAGAATFAPGVETGRSLEDITPEEIFTRCMEMRNVAEDRQADLLAAFNELVALWQDKQRQAGE